MQKGSSIEALSYFVKAKSSDNNLARASKLISRAGIVVATTDFASSARNKIKLRNEFIALISDTTDYFKKNFPYIVVYDPNLMEGKMNYAENTFNMNFKFSIILNHEAKELCQNIYAAYLTMPDHENWELEDSMKNMIPKGHLLVRFDLKDYNQKLIGTSEPYDFSLTGFNPAVGSYHRRNNSYVPWGEVTVSADADTSSIIFGVADTQYTSETNSYALSRNPESYQKIELSKLTITDYINKVLMSAFEKTEIIPGVMVMTVSRGIGVEAYNDLLSSYGYPVLSEIAKQIAGKPSVSVKSIVFNADEAKIIDKLSTGTDMVRLSNAIGRSIVTEIGHVYIKDGKFPFPRDKAAFSADYVKYLPLEFVRIKESSDLLFLKNTENLIALMHFETNGDMRFSNEHYRYCTPSALSVFLKDSNSSDEEVQSVAALYAKTGKVNKSTDAKAPKIIIKQLFYELLFAYIQKEGIHLH